MARNPRLHPRPVLSRQQRATNRMAAVEAGIRTRKIGRSGTVNRRILAELTHGGVTRSYHATKGWRVVRT